LRRVPLKIVGARYIVPLFTFSRSL
jgi:hypothetical protein